MEHTERMQRPDVVSTSAQRIKTAITDGREGEKTSESKVYVRIGIDEEGDPIEVFIDIGESGGVINGWAEALAKTISSALRSGTQPEHIAKDLMNIRSPYVAWDNKDRIDSVPDAVGVALMRFLKGREGQTLHPDPEAEEDVRQVTAEESKVTAKGD